MGFWVGGGWGLIVSRSAAVFRGSAGARRAACTGFGGPGAQRAAGVPVCGSWSCCRRSRPWGMAGVRDGLLQGCGLAPFCGGSANWQHQSIPGDFWGWGPTTPKWKQQSFPGHFRGGCPQPVRGNTKPSQVTFKGVPLDGSLHGSVF